MRRPTTFILLISLLAISYLPAHSQSSPLHKAQLLTRERGSLKRKNVSLSHENRTLRIVEKGAKGADVAIPFESVKKIEYTYSERLQIVEGIGAGGFNAWLFTQGPTVLFPAEGLGAALIIGAIFLDSKKKKHWLLVQTDAGSLVFELQKSNYRQLLFEMNSNGLPVEDSGKRRSSPLKPIKRDG